MTSRVRTRHSEEARDRRDAPVRPSQRQAETDTSDPRRALQRAREGLAAVDPESTGLAHTPRRRAAHRPGDFLALQQTIGNRAVGRLLERGSSTRLAPPVQAKLTVGPVDDPYEREADQVAREVVHRLHEPSPAPRSAPAPSRNAEDELALRTKPILQRHADELGGVEVSPPLEASIERARGGGQPLPASVREPMEQALEADFGGVRVHTGAGADRLNRALEARAFTTGRDIFFRGESFQPASREGQELIAHELTHVVQQSGTAARRRFDGTSASGSLAPLADNAGRIRRAPPTATSPYPYGYAPMTRSQTPGRALRYDLFTGDYATPGGLFQGTAPPVTAVPGPLEDIPGPRVYKWPCDGSGTTLWNVGIDIPIFPFLVARLGVIVRGGFEARLTPQIELTWGAGAPRNEPAPYDDPYGYDPYEREQPGHSWGGGRPEPHPRPRFSGFLTGDLFANLAATLHATAGASAGIARLTMGVGATANLVSRARADLDFFRRELFIDLDPMTLETYLDFLIEGQLFCGFVKGIKTIHLGGPWTLAKLRGHRFRMAYEGNLGAHLGSLDAVHPLQLIRRLRRALLNEHTHDYRDYYEADRPATELFRTLTAEETRLFDLLEQRTGVYGRNLEEEIEEHPELFDWAIKKLRTTSRHYQDETVRGELRGHGIVAERRTGPVHLAYRVEPDGDIVALDARLPTRSLHRVGTDTWFAIARNNPEVRLELPQALRNRYFPSTGNTSAALGERRM